MLHKKLHFFFCLLAATSIACASSTDIFPINPLSTDPDQVEFPNPISILADPANDQILVINSNVDFLYKDASALTINIDATDPANPILTPTFARDIPNYAGAAIFDGTSAYVTYREEGDGGDIIEKYTVGAGSIDDAISGVTQANPFGLAFDGTDVVVVCDNELERFDGDLASQNIIDLSTASGEFDDSSAGRAESVAIDTVNNRAYISNRTGKVLVVDLATATLTHVIDGPINSRGIATDGNLIYVVDGDRPALWILDPALLPAVSTTPGEVDDSTLVVKIISLGSGPNGIALDIPNNRAYVANSIDTSVSVIDLILQEEMARISLDDDDTGLSKVQDPFTLAVGTFDGVDLVFVANFDSDNIAVINADTLDVLQVFP